MNFNALSWAAVCFYYRSVGDKKYGKIMTNTSFISKLREAPFDISDEDFEEKVILDHVNIENYDLLVKHNLAGHVLAQIVKLQRGTSSLQNITILDCDLSDDNMVERIIRIYVGLCSVHGLWLTGVTKILHLLNDKLFPILNLSISDYFRLPKSKTELVEWLRLVQQDAQEVTKDFHEQGFSGSPAAFLSDKLGYTSSGYEKSLVKFLDEYYWLRFGDNLLIPPKWVPHL